MLSLLFIIIPFLSQYQVFSSPVLLWSNSNLPRTDVPLSKLSSLYVISNYVCKIDTRNVQVRLFAVDGLTSEDIQRVSKDKHQLLLDANDEKSQYRYFPDVADDIYTAFSLIPGSNNMQCSHIRFQITSSNKYKKLEDALNEMQSTVSTISTNAETSIVMALVSDSVADQSVDRNRRAVEVTTSDVLVSDDESCMFYADKLYWSNASEQKNLTGNLTLDLHSSSCTPGQIVTPTGNITSVILNLYWSNGTTDLVSMTLMANITGRYWYLEKAIFNGSEYRYFAYGMHSQMDTPPTYSYVCKTAVFVKYDSTMKYGAYDFKDKFFLTNLQFQPFFGNGSYFGPPNYCTSFFTSGIWMGITSSLLCLGILLFGVYRMMSIKSNDRFDDPKGKPLIIKAQE